MKATEIWYKLFRYYELGDQLSMVNHLLMFHREQIEDAEELQKIAVKLKREHEETRLWLKNVGEAVKGDT